MNQNIVTLNVEKLEVLNRKTRHIIYDHKEKLSSVLRYNDGGIVVPVYIENELRAALKTVRDSQKTEIDKDIKIGNNGTTFLAGKRNGKGREFEVGNKTFHSIETSGDTYKHTGTQGLALHKYGKISLEAGDIDESQYVNDKIRNNLHDRNEYITDDIAPFNKTNGYRKREKEVEHRLIMQQTSLDYEEKEYLKSVLNYKKNSRFKMYEHMLLISDAINMKEKKENYNEILSVIYEILKFNLPRFLLKLELDSGKMINKLELSGIRAFFIDHINKIDGLFTFLEANKIELFHEYRFLNNKYSESDLEGNFEEFQKTWIEIKEKINTLEKKNKLVK